MTATGLNKYTCTLFYYFISLNAFILKKHQLPILEHNNIMPGLKPVACKSLHGLLTSFGFLKVCALIVSVLH